LQAVALHALLVHSGDAALAKCDLAGSSNGSPPWTPAEDALVKSGTSYRELPGSHHSMTMRHGALFNGQLTDIWRICDSNMAKRY
jgi:hypothetical protein